MEKKLKKFSRIKFENLPKEEMKKITAGLASVSVGDTYNATVNCNTKEIHCDGSDDPCC